MMTMTTTTTNNNNKMMTHILPKSFDIQAMIKPTNTITTAPATAAATSLASKQLVVEMLVPGMVTAHAQEGSNSSCSSTMDY